MYHIKTYYLNVPKDVEDSGIKAVPESSRVVRFCMHTMHTYGTILSKLSEVFLNIELGVQEEFITDISHVCIILPKNLDKKFKPSDNESSLKRIEWFIKNLKPTSNGLVISVYHAVKVDSAIDSQWNLNNIWTTKKTWNSPGNYVTVQFPENLSQAWNYKNFYENWDYIEKYLVSKNIEIKKISYKTGIDEVYNLLLNSKLHIGYVGSIYCLAALTRTPTLGLGRTPHGKYIKFYKGKGNINFPYFENYRKNVWAGSSPMAYNRIMQIDSAGKIYNGYVDGSLDTEDLNQIKRVMINVIENNNYDEFKSGIRNNSIYKMDSRDYPWNYMMVDNFLPKEDFEFLKKKAMEIDYDTEKVTRKIFDYDPTPELEFIFKTFENQLGNNYTLKIREYSNLKKFIHFAITPENFVHKMHVEAPFKIMSAVLYLGPEENRGTRLYKTPDGEPIEIEWKPNRLFVFCGHDHTFHDYLSSSVRYTYNWFLVDEPVVENPEYRENLIDLEYIKG